MPDRDDTIAIRHWHTVYNEFTDEVTTVWHSHTFSDDDSDVYNGIGAHKFWWDEAHPMTYPPKPDVVDPDPEC